MKSYATQFGFHNIHDANLQVRPLVTWREDTEFTYTFENFFHPFVGELIETAQQGVAAGVARRQIPSGA